ncbi:unnamed protein product [Mytilus edulis]|uniref:Uncharacterized protein n=1 Tax=Mytilus edulis TaxID=6550 RepID=A0A8S3U772_MYTED|nr:unnamed protein product [Mytilus edulis]
MCGPKIYICLFDLLKSYSTNKTVFTEICGPEDVSREGSKYILNPNLEQVSCNAIQYQPFTFKTNGNSQCALSRSLCKSSGQILASNGSSFSDASCRCDYTRSFDYIIPPKDHCSCKPAEEDCSCYIRNCDDDKVMIADYRCVTRVKTILPEDIKCPIISRIIPPEETDAVDKNQFLPFLSSANVKGLRDKQKRLRFYQWIKNQKCKISFIQETHFNTSLENVLTIESDHSCYYNRPPAEE